MNPNPGRPASVAAAVGANRGEDRSEAPAPPTPPHAAAGRSERPRWQSLLRAEWRLATAGVLLLLGVAFVMLGWYGAAHTNIFTEQIPYLISGGLLGLGLIIVAGFMAYAATADRGIQALREDIARTLAQRPAPPPGGPALAAVPGIERRPETVLVLGGGRSYHVPGCPIVDGKDEVGEIGIGEAERKGLAPCKLCGPD